MSNNTKLTILGHIAEIRQRLLKSAIAIVITTILSFVFARYIFQVLTLPVKGYPLIFIEMTEMIGTYMRVCLITGIILAMPYLVYQFFMFVAPALSSKEKRYVYLIVPWVALMFLGGVVFSYFILIPPAARFLFTFGSDIATPQIKIGNYVSIVARLLLAVGLIFELPVITTFLARLGVITSRWLANKRKGAFIIAFILSAMITPTVDPVNQCLVAVPLIVLYEMSIWLARIFQKRATDVIAPASSPVS